MRSDRVYVRVLFAALLATATMVATSSNALAFCRTTTVPPPPDLPADTCFDEGAPLYHVSQCVPYHLLSAKATRDLHLSDLIARAFATWTSPIKRTSWPATCTPGIVGIELAPVDDAKIADYKAGEHGHNVFGVVEGPWPHEGSSDTLALTTLTYRTDNGEFAADSGQILDVDLEVRQDVNWYLAPEPGQPDTVPATGYDLQSVVTHEVGHALGIAHSGQKDAVMFAAYSPGQSSQRKLADDDAQAICEIYPGRDVRRTLNHNLTPSAICDLAPAASSSGTCGDPVIAHGCSVGSTSPRDVDSLAGFGILGVLGALTWRARRRQQHP